MTDTPHFTAMDAYRAVFEATKETTAFMEYSPDKLGDEINKHPLWVVDGDVNFATLADHINAAIAEAVKAERAKLDELKTAAINLLGMVDELEEESGRDVGWDEEDTFRMGEWFSEADHEAIMEARRILAALGYEATT